MSIQLPIDKIEVRPSLMSYPHHVGSPQIVPTDLTPFKRNGTTKANKMFDRRYEELIKEAENLQQSFIITQEVYGSSYKFEPIVGEIYHLYEEDNGNKFLSLIEPTSWGKKYLYSAVLNSDMTWTKTD